MINLTKIFDDMIEMFDKNTLISKYQDHQVKIYMESNSKENLKKDLKENIKLFNVLLKRNEYSYTYKSIMIESKKASKNIWVVSFNDENTGTYIEIYMEYQEILNS